MFFDYDNANIRYYGRWGVESPWNPGMASTACGAKLEFAFSGTDAVLHFDTANNAHPYPHLYISVDGGAKTEAPLHAFLRVQAAESGAHTVTVILKSAVEAQHRWHSPLIAKVSFLGVTADALLPLPENRKKTIEFVGDSITEGVLVDADLSKQEGIACRVFQDDVTATYAYLTAQALDLEPYFMGYGAVGITKGGQGAVPKCEEAYPYCFNGVRKTYKSCDYILINHGANDQNAPVQTYLDGYRALLDQIIAANPASKLFVLSAFCGAHHRELGELICAYNREKGTAVHFIDSTGWVPKEPLHPLRAGHRVIAQHLIPILKDLL